MRTIIQDTLFSEVPDQPSHPVLNAPWHAPLDLVVNTLERRSFENNEAWRALSLRLLECGYGEHRLRYPTARRWHVELVFEPNRGLVVLRVHRQPQTPLWQLEVWRQLLPQTVDHGLTEGTLSPTSLVLLVVLVGDERGPT